MNLCTVPGCERPVLVKSRGWCRLHYGRWQRHGDPSIVKPPGFPARPRDECAFPGCKQPSKRGGRGWCGRHYTRWYRHGDPAVNGNHLRTSQPVRDRIEARSAVRGDCICWTGPTYPNGYGYLAIKRRGKWRQEYVHRAMWIETFCPIPDGHHIHHVCGVRLCVKPEHLECLTPAEHAARHKHERSMA